MLIFWQRLFLVLGVVSTKDVCGLRNDSDTKTRPLIDKYAI